MTAAPGGAPHWPAGLHESSSQEDAEIVAFAIGRACGMTAPEVQALVRYLRRLEAIEHELRQVHAQQRSPPGLSPPHEGPGGWREPHPARG